MITTLSKFVRKCGKQIRHLKKIIVTSNDRSRIPQLFDLKNCGNYQSFTDRFKDDSRFVSSQMLR